MTENTTKDMMYDHFELDDCISYGFHKRKSRKTYPFGLLPSASMNCNSRNPR
jgi:hypothetical protein